MLKFTYSLNNFSKFFKLHFLFSSFNCWKCKKDNHTTSLECTMCGYLVHPDYSIKKINFYTLFGIPLKYNVDKKIVNQKGKDLQKKYHPDNFTTKDRQSQMYSTEFSSYVNEGKEILMNDLKRGLYLLEIKGIQLKENDMQLNLSKDFLLEIFDTLQNISESNNPQELQAHTIRVRKQLEVIKKEFSDSYDLNRMQQCKKIISKMEKLIETKQEELANKCIKQNQL